MPDIFPELGTDSSSGARRKRPPRYRDPYNPDQLWSGIGRTPKWVQAILDERGIDMAAFKSIPMCRIQPRADANGRPWGPNFVSTHSLRRERDRGACNDRRRGERNHSDRLPRWDEWPRPLQRGPPARPCGSCLAERNAHLDETHVRDADERIGAIMDAAIASGREKLRHGAQDCQEDAHQEGERRSIRCSPNAPSCGSGEPV